MKPRRPKSPAALQPGSRYRGAAAAGGSAGRPAGDPGATHPSATTTLADRGVVLHRPLRPGRREHGRPAAPAHGTTNCELVVQWGSGAPRQRRRARAGPARRAESDDRGCRHLSFRSVGRSRPALFCTVSSSGWRCLTPIATQRATSPTTRPAAFAAGCVRHGCFSESWPAAVRRRIRSTPLLGAQIDLDANAALDIDVDPAFEHGVLCDSGAIEMDGTALAVADLGYQGPGRLTAAAQRGGGPARVLLLGGTPFTEELVMWWNFVGRSHDDIVGLSPTVGGRRRTLRRRPGLPGTGRPAARPAAADRPAAAPAYTATKGKHR